MERYLYSPYELALIIQYHRMDIAEYTELLQNIFIYDNLYIQREYRQNKKRFFLDVMDKLNYINDHEQYDLEQADIERDMEELGLRNNSNDTEQIFSHLIFKEMRIKILYINRNGYTRMKLRTMLSELGYKKRSPNVINYIIDCLLFYHISVSLRDNVPCDIEKIGLDEMITFRTI